MSDREGGEHRGRRTHSRRSREPSPKRPRRHGRLESEKRSLSTRDVNRLQDEDKDSRDKRHSQDVVSDKTQLEPKPNNSRADLKKPSEEKLPEVRDDKKKHLSANDLPRSRSSYQHNERSGRRYERRHTEERKWRDSKEETDAKSGDRTASHDMKVREEGKQAPRTGEGNWRHDRFSELEADPPSRKRPAFSEKKVVPKEGIDGDLKTEGVNHNMHESEKPARLERWDDRKDRTENRFSNHEESNRRPFTSRDRFGPRNRYEGRDNYNSRNYERNWSHKNNVQAEKWKHDLYDDANSDAPPNNEEDQIAKVEALLALR